MLTIYTDGASLGNPGKVGIGYCIYREGRLVMKKGHFLGTQSNNFAEYMALIFSLTEVLALGEKSCQIYSDSQLLCEQLNGSFKVKNNNIFPLFILAKALMEKLTHCTITYIPREKNQEADRLAKNAAGCLPEVSSSGGYERGNV